MGLQCAWLDRTWEVDPSKIHGIDNMSFKYGIDEETGAWKKQELTISCVDGECQDIITF